MLKTNLIADKLINISHIKRRSSDVKSLRAKQTNVPTDELKKIAKRV